MARGNAQRHRKRVLLYECLFWFCRDPRKTRYTLAGALAASAAGIIAAVWIVTCVM